MGQNAKCYPRVEKLGSQDPLLLSVLGCQMFWGGKCTKEQILDKNTNAFYEGDCVWKKGWDLLLKAHKLDIQNITPGDNFALATGYNLWGEFEIAQEILLKSPVPGFIWYDIHSGLADDAAGKVELARKKMESIKNLLGIINFLPYTNILYFGK